MAPFGIASTLKYYTIKSTDAHLAIRRNRSVDGTLVAGTVFMWLYGPIVGITFWLWNKYILDVLQVGAMLLIETIIVIREIVRARAGYQDIFIDKVIGTISIGREPIRKIEEIVDVRFQVRSYTVGQARMAFNMNGKELLPALSTSTSVGPFRSRFYDKKRPIEDMDMMFEWHVFKGEIYARDAQLQEMFEISRTVAHFLNLPLHPSHLTYER